MTANIICNMEVLSDNYYFKYGLNNMLSRLGHCDVTFSTEEDIASDAIITFRRTIVSINYEVNTTPRDASSRATELVVDISFSCDSLSFAEVMVKLEKILSLSQLTLSSLDDRNIYQKMGLKNHLQLSKTESKVLRYFGMGRCPKDIANELGCSNKTVSTHCRNAMRKMGISKKSELYHFAAFVKRHSDRERVTVCL